MCKSRVCLWNQQFTHLIHIIYIQNVDSFDIKQQED